MVSEAFAMAGNGAQQGNPYSGIIMLVLMFAIFYFLLIRPQQKRAKQHRELLDALQAGDEVVTAGGIHGRITAIQDSVVTLEIATGVKIKVNRASVANKKAQ
ncbi:preprotein translocase subunit YajC [Geoalkalibacter halelectricus]|uniref:Sec translocon accessory complex subunit YajC n=1 Tax=Geoalkalibacter halelectricus TaxID=2847045 RepID=A0ABY5ZL47_9BACT|nr:preprotein translocase subunit YajC [Geoalkalibacter halelectricus]MDO3379426.1 preprotein translocase subunit YajC [Geoalkalibacter halelectricus]UWZ78697.1 preprotein translocase subunit YajC [Geoalkalibacter halelectricus]